MALAANHRSLRRPSRPLGSVAEAEFHAGGARDWKDVVRKIPKTVVATLDPPPLRYGLCAYGFVDEPWMDVVGYESANGDNEAYGRWIPEGPPSQS